MTTSGYKRDLPRWHGNSASLAWGGNGEIEVERAAAGREVTPKVVVGGVDVGTRGVKSSGGAKEEEVLRVV